MTVQTSPEIGQLTGAWDLDPAHTVISFAARHAMVATVRGRFREFTGVLQLDAQSHANSSAEVTIQTASVDSGVQQRDEHLRGDDFLDVKQYPTMTFKSTRAELNGDEYTLYGDLTIKDVTKPVELDVEYNGTATDPYGNLRAGFDGRTTINRKDWGLGWNVALEAGGILIGEKIKIELDVSAIKRSEKVQEPLPEKLAD
jgi:polyisoprenoid-binding protein YceI